jgi:Na+/phosphate symporter
MFQSKYINTIITIILLLDHKIKILKNKEYDQLNDFKDKKSEFLKSLKKVNKNQIKRIKSKNSKTRKSILFFNIITELRNIAFISEDLIEALNGLYSTNDFIKEHK